MTKLDRNDIMRLGNNQITTKGEYDMLYGLYVIWGITSIFLYHKYPIVGVISGLILLYTIGESNRRRLRKENFRKRKRQQSIEENDKIKSIEEELDSIEFTLNTITNTNQIYNNITPIWAVPSERRKS
mgnify:FL=1